MVSKKAAFAVANVIGEIYIVGKVILVSFSTVVDQMGNKVFKIQGFEVDLRERSEY